MNNIASTCKQLSQEILVEESYEHLKNFCESVCNRYDVSDAEKLHWYNFVIASYKLNKQSEISRDNIATIFKDEFGWDSENAEAWGCRYKEGITLLTMFGQNK